MLHDDAPIIPWLGEFCNDLKIGRKNPILHGNVRRCTESPILADDHKRYHRDSKIRLKLKFSQWTNN